MRAAFFIAALLALATAAWAQSAPPQAPTLDQRLADRLLLDVANYEAAYTAERKQNQLMQAQSIQLAEWWAGYVRGLPEQHADAR